MGFMSLIGSVFGSKKALSPSDDGGHHINKNKVMSPTDDQVITPKNPGNFSSIRTAPVVTDPRYFSRQESTALCELARKKESEAKHSKKAYKALKRIDNADVVVHKAHRGYEGKIATNELQKVESNARLARKLHALRPEYVEVGGGLEKAEKTANDAIAAIKAGLR